MKRALLGLLALAALGASAQSISCATGATVNAGSPLVITCASTTPVPQPPTPPTPPAPPTGTCPSVSYAPITLNNNAASGPWTIINLPSGVVGSFPLPNVNARYNGGTMHYSAYSQSPEGGLQVEITISKCRGEITTAVPAFCSLVTTIADYQSIGWVGGASQYDPATWGYCNAPQSQGPWYMNIRYTYSVCHFPPCGFQWAWYDSQL